MGRDEYELTPDAAEDRARRQRSAAAVVLRRRTTLHDGRPLTAKDAIYVLRDRTTDPKSTYKEAFADIKANDIKLLDTRTFAAPDARLMAAAK